MCVRSGSLRLAWVAALLIGACARADVDPTLIGTWKFDGVMADMFWVVQADGGYRLHGWGVTTPQRGRFEGAGGAWSVEATGWQDAGSYRLPDADTWVVTGKLGTGAWKRVWGPAEPLQNGPSPGGVCRLLEPADVTALLASPISDGEATGARNSNTGEALEGCRFESRLSATDRIEFEVHSTLNRRERAYHDAKGQAEAPLAVPGLGTDAYATVNGNAPMVVVLGKNSILSVALYVTPSAPADDLPKLIELARLMYGRL